MESCQLPTKSHGEVMPGSWTRPPTVPAWQEAGEWGRADGWGRGHMPPSRCLRVAADDVVVVVG